MSEALKIEQVFVPWTLDADEQRRAYVLEICADFNINELEERFQWLKHGSAKVAGSPILRPVK